MNTQFSLAEDFVISEESLKLYKKYAKEDVFDQTTGSLYKIPSISQFSASSIISLAGSVLSIFKTFMT